MLYQLITFGQWIKSQTIHRRAAEDIELLGQATRLPIQVTSGAWPGLIPVILWIDAGINGAKKGFLVIHGCRYPVKLLVGKFARWRFLKPGAEYLPFAKSFPSFKGTHIIVAGDQKGSIGYQVDLRL